MEDIDAGAFRSFLRAQGLDTEEEPQPPITDDLRNRRILTDFDGALRPTPLRLDGLRQGTAGAPPDHKPLRPVRGLYRGGPGLGGDSLRRGKGASRRAGTPGRRLGPGAGMDRALPRPGTRGPAPGPREGVAGGDRQRRRPPRLRDHRVKGPARGLPGPHRRDQPRHAPESHEGGERPLGREPPGRATS